MSIKLTPPFSLEAWREIEEEMLRPPADTPERRRMLELARAMEPLVIEAVEGRAVIRKSV